MLGCVRGLALLAFFMLLGCESRSRGDASDSAATRTKGRDQAPPNDTDGSLTATSADVQIRNGSGFYEVRVPFVYVNRRTTPVGNPGCNPPMPPGLQWWNGERWTPAHPYVSSACRSLPFIITPGMRHSGAVELRIDRDSTGLPSSAYWYGSLNAWYRLAWDLVDPVHSAKGASDGPPIPERQRVSAPFRLPRPK